jgi:uncharacterized protein YqgC (DUF456 family)
MGNSGAFRYGAGMMRRIVLAPHGASRLGMTGALIATILIFFFGAPAWIILPMSLISATVYLRAASRIDHRSEKR